MKEPTIQRYTDSVLGSIVFTLSKIFPTKIR